MTHTPNPARGTATLKGHGAPGDSPATRDRAWAETLPAAGAALAQTLPPHAERALPAAWGSVAQDVPAEVIISLSGMTSRSAGAPAPSQTGHRSTVLPRVALVDSRPALIQDAQPRYEELSRLGAGGMGLVTKARDNDIGRMVAVKRLLPAGRDATSLARFAEEIRTVGSLEHPNIIPIHDVGLDEHGDHYFVMKYVGGETLADIIQRLGNGDAETHRRFPFERRVEIFARICEAVAYAHAHGVIHRDLKPANVMVGTHGEVQVMDWGLARRLDAPPEDRAVETVGTAPVDLRLTDPGALVGTPAYMAPEQARAETMDARSDIYALAVLLHEFLSLRHYLDDKRSRAEMLAAIQQEEPSLSSFFSHPHQQPVPADLAWFVKKGLAKRPEDRFQSVAEMLDRLERRREGDIPIQCHVTLAKRTSNVLVKAAERHPMVFMAFLGFSVMAALGGLVRAFW